MNLSEMRCGHFAISVKRYVFYKHDEVAFLMKLFGIFPGPVATWEPTEVAASDTTLQLRSAPHLPSGNRGVSVFL